MALKRAVFVLEDVIGLHLLAACVFGHSFGSLTDCVFGEFTRQEKTNSSLDLSRRDRRLLVVVSQTGSFSGDSLEDVVHEGVHDAHGFAGNTSVGMNLLHNLVDVDGVTFFTFRPPFLTTGTDSTFLAGFLSTFARNSRFGRHLLKQLVFPLHFSVLRIK